MVTFDTNVLVYATTAAPDAKAKRSRDLIVRGMQSGWSILLLQTLAEFSSVAIRKAGIPIDDIRATIDAWRAVLPVQAAEDGDLAAALDAVKAHRLAFLGCDAVGCGATCVCAALAHRGPAGRLRAAGRQIRQPIRTSERSIDRRNSSAIVNLRLGSARLPSKTIKRIAREPQVSRKTVRKVPGSTRSGALARTRRCPHPGRSLPSLGRHRRRNPP